MGQCRECGTIERKRCPSCEAIDGARIIDEAKAEAREEERERFAKICDDSAEYWERLAREAGENNGQFAFAFALAAECLRSQARMIRGGT